MSVRFVGPVHWALYGLKRWKGGFESTHFEPAQPTEEELTSSPSTRVGKLGTRAPDSDGGEQLKATPTSRQLLSASSAAERVLVTEASRLQEHVQVLEAAG